MNTLKIALAGNPNCGKTTLFNALTGARQRVGNWPGVTVERVEGEYIQDGYAVQVTDLPGIYSFSALSPDEEVARKHILFDRPDVVVNVLDASNLERNLYLTTQLLEMNVPMVVVLNMMDVAAQRGLRIEVAHLAAHLDCPVIPVTATRKTGMDALYAAIREIGESQRRPDLEINYGSDVEKVLTSMEHSLRDVALSRKISARWLAVKLVEKDELATEIFGAEKAVLPNLSEPLKKLERIMGEDADMIVADGRYGFIHGLAKDVMTNCGGLRKTVSDRIDRLALSRFFGIPFFFAVMYLVFALTIQIGGPFIDFFDGLCGTIFVDGFGVLLRSIHCPEWLTAILSDGIGGGIQTVSTFIPPIFFIFLSLSFLEDSGYMARAAFVMDRFLRMVGLPGKAFIPMLVGFGCNVPGITATRTLESHRDRVLAILMNPFMSCGARLPVYVLFASAFFPERGGLVIFGIYLIGILLAVMTGFLFKSTLLKGEISSFVMELPPYHLPTFRGILYHTWHRLKSFLIKAGKVILLIVALLGFLNTLGTDGSFGNNDSKDSALSAMSRAVTPIFRPMGIRDENWPATVGLFTGIFAKEAVVGTLDSIYAQLEEKEQILMEEDSFDFGAGIAAAFASIPEGFEGFFDGLKDPLGLKGALDEVEEADANEALTIVERFGEQGKMAAMAYMLFILIYAPCVAALAAIYREIGWRWMGLAVSYLTLLAWVVATTFYQIATFSLNPAGALLWLSVCALICIGFYGSLRSCGSRTRTQIRVNRRKRCCQKSRSC